MEGFELLARDLALGIQAIDATAEVHATDGAIIDALTARTARGAGLRASRQGRATA